MESRIIIALPLSILIILTSSPAVSLPIPSEESQNLKTPMDDLVISMIQQVHPAVFLHQMETLLANGPRPTQSPACTAAAQYLYDQFQTMGLSVRYHRWNNTGYSSENVEATINGTDNTSDDIYLICAHYDTVTASPGADDDTSGTVAVLTAALILSQYLFNHTIKFVAFSGEEQGLLGSQVYAQEAYAQGWDIIGVLNCDMISYANTTTDGSNLDVCQNTASAWLYDYTQTVNTRYTDYIGPLTLHNDGTSSGSDHYYFWQYGYDAIFYHEYEPTPYYHSAQDTIAHINLTYVIKNTRLLLATLAELAEVHSNPPAPPLLTGPDTGVIHEPYTYQAITMEPEDEDVYYYFDWGDGTNSSWLGPYHSGEQAAAQKAWNHAGAYTIRVKAKDINQVPSDWSLPHIMTITPNHPPNTPVIHGPTEGKPDTAYLYTFTTLDSDEDMVYYYIDWGDNQVSEWVGPYASGATASVAHEWSEGGTYIIKAKAKDIVGNESDWATLSVTMPSSTTIPFQTFWDKFFERLPNAFLLLRHLMGY